MPMRSTCPLRRVLISGAMFFAASISAAGADTSTYCDSYAHYQAERASVNTSRGVPIGASTVNGGTDVMANIGLGAVRGNARRNRDYTNIYQHQYDLCMHGK